MTRFWWVRHGPVENGPAGVGVILGQSDVPCTLTDTPRLALLRQRLPQTALVISSPLQRAQETAQAVFARPADAVDAALAEQDFGRWTGKRWDAVGTEAQALGFWDTPALTAPPGGESVADHCRRVAAFVASWQERAEDIVCVCHAGTIRAALAQALGCAGDPDPVLRFAIDPLSLTRIDALEQHFRIESVNERFPP